jgi:hypothetical protein
MILAKATPKSPYLRLATTTRSERRRLFEAGEAPDIDVLTGYEYRGLNTAWIARLLGIRKFVKAFFTAEADTYGCNTPVHQNALEEDWRAKPSEDAPRRFAFYSVEPPGDRRHPHAVLLDYGRGRNGFFQPARLLRDYVVRAASRSDVLLLGKAYLTLGPLHLPMTYFILERRRALPDEPHLPHG